MISLSLISLPFCVLVAGEVPVEQDAATTIGQAVATAEHLPGLCRRLGQILVDGNQSPLIREKAAGLLGKLKSRAAIEPLISALEFRALVPEQGEALDRYPAAKALKEQGSNVYPDVYGRLSRECSDEYLYILAFVLVEIDGRSLAATRLSEKAMRLDTLPAVKANIEKLLRIVRTVEVENRLHWPK